MLILRRLVPASNTLRCTGSSESKTVSESIGPIQTDILEQNSLEAPPNLYSQSNLLDSAQAADSVHSFQDSSPFLFQLAQALLETLNEGVVILSVHVPGLPWWGTVVVAAIILRTATTLPIVIYQRRAEKRLADLAPLLSSWNNALKHIVQLEAASKKLSPVQAHQLYQKKVLDFYF
ncbi:hypothetical protein BB560_000430 [Smittium megazygosporum]|uniref:Uncharacterized protein n=1 Tax=Smittium megazygosporum TaxID=133381 RepID=A0A2T9ZKF3_9FUNG|nr:hypothetical protein BB560_000426 [Smittium megazygosporum]PVV05061.1 hypothetical protein BB560_000430 [Smittium megazygosporum]